MMTSLLIEKVEKVMPKIPKKISIAGMELKTIIDDELCDKQGSIGKIDYINQEIHIDSKAASAQMTEQAYIHEVMHFMMFMLKKDDLRQDEEFIDMLAHFVYQAFTTAEY